MNNLFIPYELAVIAYKKGFEINGYGIGWYYKRRDTGEIHGLDTFYIDTNQNIEQWDKIDEPIEAILYQQILDWFREKHNIHICYEFHINTFDVNITDYRYIVHYKRNNIWLQNQLIPSDINWAIEEALKLI